MTEIRIPNNGPIRAVVASEGQCWEFAGTSELPPNTFPADGSSPQANPDQPGGGAGAGPDDGFVPFDSLPPCIIYVTPVVPDQPDDPETIVEFSPSPSPGEIITEQTPSPSQGEVIVVPPVAEFSPSPSPGEVIAVSDISPSPSVGAIIAESTPSPSPTNNLLRYSPCETPSPSAGAIITEASPSPSAGIVIVEQTPSPSAGMTVVESSPESSPESTSSPFSESSPVPVVSVDITSDSSLISAVVDDLYFDLSLIPSENAFWSNVSSDGGNIRIAHIDTPTGYLPFEISGFDKDNNKGSLFFDCSSNVSTSTDVTWRISIVPDATMPAEGDALGKHTVWSNANAAGVWHLEEDPSGSAPQSIDSTSNSNDGTSYGSMVTGDLVNGQIENGWIFNGSTQGSNMGKADELMDFGTGDFAVMGWVKWTNLDGGTPQKIITAATTGSTSLDRWGLDTNNSNRFRVFIGDQSGGEATAVVSSDSTFTTGQWYHSAFVRRSNTVYLYVDGSEQASTAAAAHDLASHATMEVHIGNSGFNGGNFHPADATIDEVRVYSATITANQIATLFNNQDNNASFWTVS